MQLCKLRWFNEDISQYNFWPKLVEQCAIFPSLNRIGNQTRLNYYRGRSSANTILPILSLSPEVEFLNKTKVYKYFLCVGYFQNCQNGIHAYTATEKKWMNMSAPWGDQWKRSWKETEALLHPCMVTLLIIVNRISVLLYSHFTNKVQLHGDVMKHFQIIVISETVWARCIE